MTDARPALRISAEQRRARVGRRHLLAPSVRAATVEEVTDAVVALHATDPATVYLSACARLREPSSAEVDRALYEDLSMMRLLCMRRTMFVVTAALAPAVYAGAGRAIAVRERATLLRHLRERADGWDEERLAAVEKEVVAALAVRGEATTAELAQDLPALRETILMSPGKPYEAKQSVGSRLLRQLAADGLVRRCRPRSSWNSSIFPWAPAAALPEVPVREAKAEIAGRWLRAFGPATEADLKWWTGWTVTDTRRALADIRAASVELAEGPGFVAEGDEEPVAECEPWAALLPSLDPTAMGWRMRDWYLDPEQVPALFDGTGNIGPTVWWNGRIVGAWTQRADGEVVWQLFTDAGREAWTALETEAARLSGWLGGMRITTRFPTGLERELAR
ncbi:winged helix DNA-binding domain-containing protein [Streptomyces sp. NA02950]|uniref:winged helix DNA-binding domain-containing protein n=1 Tax=Streptomyces sp. NA02950 TaxID=2742137 RepID=UPI00158FB895|nr:winged helix DNA-binding domain-containing protein [Streptomyces sp. NA02950]QKV94385.1 winged helix DNA-binding domain-containing protein [Streptomyces sp. NA02950]